MKIDAIENPTATPYLPTEVVREILSYTTPRVLINARKSCRQLRDVIDGDRNLYSCIQNVKEMTSTTAVVYKKATPIGAIPASRVDFPSYDTNSAAVHRVYGKHTDAVQRKRYDKVRDRPFFNRELHTVVKDDLTRRGNCHSFFAYARAFGFAGAQRNSLLSKVEEYSFVFTLFCDAALGSRVGAGALTITQAVVASCALSALLWVGLVALATVLSYRVYHRNRDSIQDLIDALAREDLDEAQKSQRIALDGPVRNMIPFEFNLLELRDYQVLAQLER